MVLSSFLAHYSSAPKRAPSNASTQASVAETLSIVLRRLGKVLAAINAMWIVISCLFQFIHFFDRCYCNSSVLGLGAKAYNVMIMSTYDIEHTKDGWIGGIVLAVGAAAMFMGFVNLFVNPPLPDD